MMMQRSLCSRRGSSEGRWRAAEQRRSETTKALLPLLPRLPTRRDRSGRLAAPSSSLRDPSEDSMLLAESRDLLRRFWKVN